jgi:ribosomal protein S18 acetylase RimI-like enzyme
MLLERAERLARGFDADEIRLHTAASNLRAQRFFIKAGYVLSDGGPSSYPNGEAALAFVHALR